VKVGASASLEGIAVRDDGTPAAGAVVLAKRIDDVPVLGPSKAAPLAPAAQASAGTTVGIVVTKGAPEVELEPVSSAAIPIGEAMETFAIAGDDGRFAILDLAEGRYRVHARIGWLRSTQREIDLAAGAIERELRFEIARGLSLSGTVVDDAGHPIPGGWVLLYREGEHLETRSLEADEEGRFRTDGLQEGRYRIDAGHQASSEGGELEHPYARASVADIVPPRSDVVVRLPRTIRIEGRVVDAGGNPLPYAIVQASDEDGRGYQGVVDAVGRFHLEVAPGSVLEIVGSWTGSVPEGDGARRLEAKLPGFVAGSREILLRLE
jgi:protocatechuate 3,4-dioxygenase beta subunit